MAFVIVIASGGFRREGLRILTIAFLFVKVKGKGCDSITLILISLSYRP